VYPYILTRTDTSVVDKGSRRVFNKIWTGTATNKTTKISEEMFLLL